MALSIGFTSFVSSTGAIQAMRSLISTSMGLSPTEHASLSWTHSLPKTLRGSARLCTTGILAQVRAPAVRRTQTASLRRLIAVITEIRRRCEWHTPQQPSSSQVR
jgi:hypothetical protein